MSYYVYWIHHKNDTDIKSNGYVGVTKNTEKRFTSHKSGKTSPIIKNALNKYKQEIVYDVFESFETLEKALEKENELRPKKHIGWNIAIGGNMPPEIKDNIDVKEKIRKKIKELGVVPYCKNTHSKKALKKAKETKKQKNYRWFHNPLTLEYNLIPINEKEIPKGWVSGRKPKIIIVNKKRGIDYECNTMCVDIFKNGVLIANNINNFKQWCKQNNLPYFAGSKTNSIRILSKTEKIFLEYEDGYVIENGTNTKMKQFEYSNHICKSPSVISIAIKKGFYEIKKYDLYEFKRI
jgi:predicted GIY-YIG superfamily endonuclease